jgi:hypothetical protein
MNFCKAPIHSSDRDHYVLVITDRLSKYVFTRALPLATVTEAAEMLYKNITIKHGFIRYLQSYHGSHSKSELLTAITKSTRCEQALSIECPMLK